jgi:hypothetical protein
MNISNLLDELEELGTEIDDEMAAKMSPAERKLHSVAQQLLILERDLKAPGVARSADERADRILEVISKESF